MDVPTGDVLAVGDYGGALLRTFLPSGTLRPLVLAAAIEEGADPNAIYRGGEGQLRVGPLAFRDHHLCSDMTMTQMVCTAPRRWSWSGGVLAFRGEVTRG